MKIIRLKTNPFIYSSNVYLLLGTWNTLNDINTLIDTGGDSYIINEIKKINTGVGKKPVEKVVLTHNHFDHTGGLKSIKEEFNPIVYAKIITNGTVNDTLYDNQVIRIADKFFTVLYSSGHSSDSISFYCEEDGVLFSGDTNLLIRDMTGTYTMEYIDTLQRFARLKITTIYPGHGDPITENPVDMLKFSISNALRSKII